MPREGGGTVGQILQGIIQLTGLVGEQTAELRGLKKSQERLAETFERDREAASESRRRLHERLDDLSERTISLEGRMTTIEASEKDTAAFVKQQRDLESGRRFAWKIARTIGTPAWTAIKWLSGLAGLAFIAFWRELKDALLGGG